jgi:hypothetical protein
MFVIEKSNKQKAENDQEQDNIDDENINIVVVIKDSPIILN